MTSTIIIAGWVQHTLLTLSDMLCQRERHNNVVFLPIRLTKHSPWIVVFFQLLNHTRVLSAISLFNPIQAMQ